MKHAVGMIHCELLKGRDIVCSTPRKFQYASIRVVIFDFHAKSLLISDYTFAILQSFWKLYALLTFGGGTTGVSIVAHAI